MAEIITPERGHRTGGAGLSFKLASKMCNRPLAMVESFAELLSSAINARAFDSPAGLGGVINASPVASKFFGQMVGRGGYHVTDDHIAIVHISGMLIDRGDFLGDFYGMMTSYEGIAEQCRRIAADDAIKAVILDIDSPGGMVAGLFDVGVELAKLAKKKSLYAIAANSACSAAYALAVTADEVYVTRTGEAGSIGAVAIHQSIQRALDSAGVDTTIIRSSPDKMSGNPYEQLSHVARATKAEEIDEAAAKFVRHVASHRNLDEAAVKALGARVYLGENAVAAKLADGVMSFEELISHIRKAKSSAPAKKPARAARANTATGATMSGPQTDDAPRLTAAELDFIIQGYEGLRGTAPAVPAAAASPSAAVAPIAAVIPAAAVLPAAVTPAPVAAAPATPTANAAADATARIQAILLSDAGKKRPQLAQHIAFNKTDMSAADALAMLAAVPEESTAAANGAAGFLAAMRAPGSSAGVKPDGAVGATGGDGQTKATGIADFTKARYAPRSASR